MRRLEKGDPAIRTCCTETGFRERLSRRITIVVLALVAAAPQVLLLSGCLGYVPGRQSYWDQRVKELCEKDGGVFVYERVKLSESEYRLLRGSGGAVIVPTKNQAGPDTPYFAETQTTKIRDGNPEVYRRETLIVRARDGKVLSRQITFGRIGGDIPSPAHSSSFGCRDVGLRFDVVRDTFEIPTPTK